MPNGAVRCTAAQVPTSFLFLFTHAHAHTFCKQFYGGGDACLTKPETLTVLFWQRAGVWKQTCTAGANRSHRDDTSTHTEAAGQAEQHGNITRHQLAATSQLPAGYSLNIRWSLWVSGTTCASHPSFLGSSSGRCLKANEARFALHSCSSLPSLSQAAVSQRCGETAHSSTVSEPASNESDERRTPFLSLCSVLLLSLHHTVLPSLCHPLSPPCPAA